MESLLETGFDVIHRRAMGEKIVVAQNLFEAPPEGALQQTDNEVGLGDGAAKAPIMLTNAELASLHAAEGPVTGPAAAIKPTNPSSERAPPELIRVKADGGDHAKPRRERGDWMVQVGAYRRKAQANAQIASLNRRFGEHLDQARGEVQAAGHGYYRARFVGLTASAAHSACAALRHHRVTCEALGPS